MNKQQLYLQKQYRIYQAVIKALHLNPYTANEAIQVAIQGYVVILTGHVTDEELIYEAVATVEALSPKLEVYSELMVKEPHPTFVRQSMPVM